MEWDNTYDLFHSPQILADCWQALSGRTPLVRKEPTQQQFEPLVSAPQVSVSSRVVYILRQLIAGGAQRMGQLFFPPPEPGRERRHLFGPAGAGARRAGDAGPGRELTMRRGRLERTKENK